MSYIFRKCIILPSVRGWVSFVTYFDIIIISYKLLRFTIFFLLMLLLMINKILFYSEILFYSGPEAGLKMLKILCIGKCG